MKSLQEHIEELDELVNHGDLVAACEKCRQLRALSGELEEGLPVAVASFYEARILMYEGRYEEALQPASSAFDKFRKLSAKYWIAWNHLVLSGLHIRLGAYAEAKAHAEAAIYHYTWEVPHDERKARAYDFLGLCCKDLGQWAEAEANLRRAVESYGPTSSLTARLRTSLNLAVLLRKVAKPNDAAPLLQEVHHLSQEIPDSTLTCQSSLELANVAVIKRDADEAERHLRIAARIAEEHAYRREQVLAREIQGDIACLKKDYEAAIEAYSSGLAQAREFARGADLEYELLGRLARAYLSVGSLEKAREAAEAAIELASKCGDAYEHALSLRSLGEIELAEGKAGCGIDHLRQALSMLLNLSSWSHETAVTELTLGKAALEHASQTEALEQLLSARRIYSHLGVRDAITEIDELLVGLVGSAKPGGLRKAIEQSHGKEFATCYEEFLRYGIVTADERIAGDLKQWGSTEVRVLIEGETGVGKELIARAMHAMSRRREEPFVVIDCASLTETLAESELFGHTRGSFTGAIRDRVGLIESTNGGTVFLDEVGELSEALQVKLLRVLEEGCVRRVGSNEPTRVDVRVLSATSRDLWAEVEAGRFRKDLYYRLKGVLIRIPPLRERPYDIELLIEYYLERYSDSYGVKATLSGEARQRLLAYTWPGNVRELRNMVEALVAIGKPRVIESTELEQFLSGGNSASLLEQAEQEAIHLALKQANGNKTKAAKILGVSRTTLWRMMERFGIR